MVLKISYPLSHTNIHTKRSKGTTEIIFELKTFLVRKCVHLLHRLLLSLPNNKVSSSISRSLLTSRITIGGEEDYGV